MLRGDYIKEATKSHIDLEVNHRKFLKILVASDGAVAASVIIPDKWLKPVVDMGVLPAHAQLSDTNPRITGLTTRPSNSFIVEFEYEDPLGLVSEDAALTSWLRGPDCKTDPEPCELGNATGNWGGIPVSFSSPGTGKARFTAKVAGGCGPCNSEIQIQMEVGGRLSNKSALVKVNDSACD